MCGIYITNIPFQEGEVRTKLKKIEFRGPDNIGVLKIKNTTIGHLRLAILDLDERANQPYSLNHLYITYNGEVYNFKSIREELISLGISFDTTSDTEVLLKGYSVWGKELLPKLNGMFAFAIYDSQKNEVFCARDRLGVKPFYYYWNNGQFEICSQLSPLYNSSLEIDKTAISIYLDCGYIPSPFSIYQGIHKLQPGYVMCIKMDESRLSFEKYWDLKKVDEYTKFSYDDAKVKLKQLLIDAVQIRMQSDVPLGSFLSGGIDSALVSAIASKYTNRTLKTFTIAFEDPNFDESKIAEQYSKIIASEHTATICTSKDVLGMLPHFVRVYDEPFADSSALPSLLLNKVTKEYVTVALSGDGGDESFIGYQHFPTISKFKKIGRIPFWIRKLVCVLLPKSSKIKNILSLRNEDEFIERIFVGDQRLSKVKNKEWLQKYYSDFKLFSNDSVQRAADLNIKLWLENDSNTKVDRASMAFSVESRSPFLDYRIVEFARTLPIRFRFENGITKRILRDILKEFIPEEVFTQPKRGFAAPICDWIRTDLREDVLSKLNDHFLERIPNLDIKEFKKQLNQHMENKRDNSYSIWKLYVLALWYQNHDIGKF